MVLHISIKYLSPPLPPSDLCHHCQTFCWPTVMCSVIFLSITFCVWFKDIHRLIFYVKKAQFLNICIICFSVQTEWHMLIQMHMCMRSHTLAQQLCTERHKSLLRKGWQISFMEESNMTLFDILLTAPGVHVCDPCLWARCVCVHVCLIYGGQKAYLCWVQWRPVLAGERNHMLLITSKCLPRPGGTRALRSRERGERLANTDHWQEIINLDPHYKYFTKN